MHAAHGTAQDGSAAAAAAAAKTAAQPHFAAA
jgi:hypothetical protein